MKQSFPPPLCDSERLRRLLLDELTESSQAQLMGHLNDCTDCRTRLDEIACSDQFWRETEALLQRDLARHSLVKRAIDVMDSPSAQRRRKRHRRRHRRQRSLELLHPSTEPESLGRLGKYEIRGIIGCGGMGTVFHAHDPTLLRPVALKVLHSKSISDEDRQRFLHEARAIAALSNPHIVRIFEVDEEIPFIAMEFVDGLSLHQLLARPGGLEFKTILRIAKQVAVGLSCAHEAGIIHRDIKPSNIMLDKKSSNVLITDFGLACTATTLSEEEDLLAGTPEYMSPEQAKGAKPVPQSDLFSLGTLLYALCTRTSPFRGPSTRETLLNVLRWEPDPLPDSVPLWFAEGVRKLHAKRPENRFASAEEFLEYLAANSEKSREFSSRTVLEPFPSESFMRFECPICGKRLKTEPNNAGQSVHCRRCNQQLRIPKMSERVEVLQVDPAVATALRLRGRAKWKNGMLVHLDLRKTLVADEHLREMRTLKDLQMLLLEGTQVTDEGMVYLRSTKSLQHLTLSMTAVTDAGLRQLTPLTNLRTLTLAHCSITDESISVLMSFPHLSRLRLDGALLTPEGIERLQLALPNLQLWA